MFNGNLDWISIRKLMDTIHPDSIHEDSDPDTSRRFIGGEARHVTSLGLHSHDGRVNVRVHQVLLARVFLTDEHP
jgi:hypothetical protein